MLMGKRYTNQRQITVNKAATDTQNIYTKNNIAAINAAAQLLQSKCGFKLYMYFAKNQDNYNFNLSSKDFCEWSGSGIEAYRSAFAELIKKGFLISHSTAAEQENYIFYDKPQPKKDNKAAAESDHKNFDY